MWFGLLGAPSAWMLQFLVGYGLTQAACSQAGSHWNVAVDGITLAATLAGAVVAMLAGLAALKVWRDTRSAEGAGGDEPPPKGRIHFLATVGIVIAPLFLFMILMGGLGAISLPECQQS
jgi:heme/copper-type cytochrome/quinol oxidase subunit 2